MKAILTDEVQEFETRHIDTVRKRAPECTLFLKRDGAFPLTKTGTIALYGNGARHTVIGGTGSGAVNVRHAVTAEEGLENAGFTITTKDWLDSYDEILNKTHEQFMATLRREAKEHHMNAIVYSMGKTMQEPEYELPLSADADACIYVLARNSGEGSDRRIAEGDICLTKSEIRDILSLNKAYEKFCLVLNVGGMVDLTPVLSVRNILLLGQLGTPTGDVLSDLLTFRSYPSGKLAMTWAPIGEYPSTEGFGDPDDTVYQEGIYVGYRYFTSFQKKPLFPFGFGLGYTDFSVTPMHFTANECEISVTAHVKNTGHFPGKEIVQVYGRAPEGSLEKPALVLCGFAKTRELAPGEEQDVMVTFPPRALTSYDMKREAFVLEKGSYTLYAGNSIENIAIAGTMAIDQDVELTKVRNLFPGGPEKELTCAVKAAEQNNQPSVLLHADRFHTKQVSYPKDVDETLTGERISWKAVLSGEKTVSDFVKGLTDEELAEIAVGRHEKNGMPAAVIGSASPTRAGAAGETSAVLEKEGVPTIVMSDGPAGLRLSPRYKQLGSFQKAQKDSLAGMKDFLDPEELEQMKAMLPKPSKEELTAPTAYVYACAIPIGTCIAQSFDPAVAECFGDLVGEEMEQFGIQLWLAPAMNIQRSPLCGRDFEYYSEDPLVSGLMAAGITRGVQSHKGCGTVIKHFACNNQETDRYSSNSIVSERALREIYLRGFEICIAESDPKALMTSYNLINGVHTNQSRELLTNVLRSEWGYQGLVMTDWYGTGSLMTSAYPGRHAEGDAAGCVAAGNDLTMPGMTEDVDCIRKALEDPSSSVTRKQLLASAEHVLEAVKELSAG